MLPIPFHSTHQLLPQQGTCTIISYFSETRTSHHCNRNRVEIWATGLNTGTPNLVT